MTANKFKIKCLSNSSISFDELYKEMREVSRVLDKSRTFVTYNKKENCFVIIEKYLDKMNLEELEHYCSYRSDENYLFYMEDGKLFQEYIETGKKILLWNLMDNKNV